jgi:hypothetical protein
VADGFDVDFSDLDRLVADLGEVPKQAPKFVRKALEVSSRHIKDDWRRQLQGSSHDPVRSGQRSYDIKSFEGFGRPSSVGDRPEVGTGGVGGLVGALEYGIPGKTGPTGYGLGALQKNQGDFEKGLSEALIGRGEGGWTVTIRAHKTAVLDRLKADPFLASITFEGIVTGGPSHYVSVFVNSGFREAERLTGPQATSTFTFTIHSVGSTPDQAQLVAEHVFAQLLDYTPTVTGRRCAADPSCGVSAGPGGPRRDPVDLLLRRPVRPHQRTRLSGLRSN